MLLSAFPVVFLGRSFVSPNFGTRLLYGEFPTLPASRDAQVSDAEGSDVGAALWQNVPYSFVEHQAAEAGQLPLWNRYDSGGTPLLAQGQSMFGDPLQLVVIAAHGAAWAWDLKYLIAKWLFAFGIGLAGLILTDAIGPAALAALAAPFVGFFIFRINHPAFFAFCYAPWVLVGWLGAGPGLRGRVAILAWANIALLNSGALKESVVLFAMMNLAGAVACVAGRRGFLVGLGTVILATLVCCPMWWSCREALRASYTGYEHPTAMQVQPSLLLGAFDEIFYRPIAADGRVFGPALNFVFLGGLLYFLATLREQNRRTRALALVSLLPLSIAFGSIPPSWIDGIPFLGQIAHVDDCFANACLILWAVLAVAGFAAAIRSTHRRSDLTLCALLLFALFFAYLGFLQAAHREVFGKPSITVNAPGHAIPMDPWITCYAISLLAALCGLAWSIPAVGIFGRSTPSADAKRGGNEEPCAPLSRNAPGKLRSAQASCESSAGPDTAPSLRGLHDVAATAEPGQSILPGRRAAARIIFVLSVATLLWRGAQIPWRTGLDPSLARYMVRPPDRADFLARDETIAKVQTLVAREPARVLGLGLNLFPAWNAVYGLEGLSGPDALMNPRYRELTSAFGLERRMDWMVIVDRDALSARQGALDFLGVRYTLDTAPNSHVPSALEIHESQSAWPRAFFTSSIEQSDSLNEFAKRFAGGAPAPFACAVGAEEESIWSTAGVNAPQAARAPLLRPISGTDYRLTPNSTSFMVRCPSSGVVVLTESLWPGYPHATLDGHPVRVSRIDGIYQGITIPTAGTHQIAVHYHPRSFLLQISIASASALLLLIAIALAV